MWFSLTSFKNNHQKQPPIKASAILYAKQNKIFFNWIKYSGHCSEQSAFNIFKIFLKGISWLFPSSNLASSTRIPNFPFFLHLSDLDCLIVGEWVESYARSIWQFHAILGEIRLLIKNHRVNKSWSRGPVLPLAQRGLHFHSSIHIITTLVVQLIFCWSSFHLDHGFSSVRWPAHPLILLPKGQEQIIWVSLLSFAFPNHFQQGSVIEGSLAWASGGVGSRPCSLHRELSDCSQPSGPWGRPLSSSVKGGIQVDPGAHEFHPLPVTSKLASAEAFFSPSNSLCI